MRKTIFLTIIACFAFSLVAAVAQESAQESAPDQIAAAADERLTIETKDKETPAMKDLKPEREYRRRLPSGFGPIVDAAQRERIYKIQAEYFELIELLKLRIELLERERDAKVEAVLTPSQLERMRPIRRLR